jgi:hypothetical protein
VFHSPTPQHNENKLPFVKKNPVIRTPLAKNYLPKNSPSFKKKQKEEDDFDSFISG